MKAPFHALKLFSCFKDCPATLHALILFTLLVTLPQYSVLANHTQDLLN